MTTPQDPYGQGQPNPYTPGQPNPYGQNQPSYPPPAPPLHEGELRGAQNLPAPQPVQISFWLWVATVVLGIVSAVVGFAQRDTLLATLRAANTQQLSEDALQTVATVSLAFAAVIAVVFAGLYLLFAFKARAGRNWARIVLTVLTALRVVFLATGFSVLNLLTVLAAVAATVLLFLPEANQFYTASKRVR
ncbi:hypothetical protein [Kutzneria sp. NPDC052558]|uniref:hypothetical protein n=1 Tax=Kutzneria sp. NPDC052558 TaxID=3364121 RepID=UPI0037CC45BC